jgi:hypothetical protein
MGTPCDDSTAYEKGAESRGGKKGGATKSLSAMTDDLEADAAIRD